MLNKTNRQNKKQTNKIKAYRKGSERSLEINLKRAKKNK